MVTWSYLLATGQIRFGGACDPEIDPLTEGKLLLRANPDPSVHRINRPGLPGYSAVPSDGVPECGLDQDGIAYVRKVTVGELTADTAAKRTDAERQSFDEQKMLKALAIWVGQQVSKTPAQVRSEVLTIYRAL